MIRFLYAALPLTLVAALAFALLTVSPAPGIEALGEPTITPSPSATASPSPTPSASPTAAATASPTPAGTAAVATATPAAVPATGGTTSGGEGSEALVFLALLGGLALVGGAFLTVRLQRRS
jgi:hypothetical protein